MGTEITQLDRVSYSESVKIQMEGTPGGKRYESRDVHLSYSTDVKLAENEVQAMSRAREFVTMCLQEEEMQIRSGSRNIEPPTPENNGNLADIKAEYEHELDILRKKLPVIAQNAEAFVAENPDTKEIYLKALKTIKEYNAKG